jgi:hypothetical protein
LAVGAGVLVVVVVTTGVDIVLHAVGVLPAMGQPLSNALAVLASAYRLVISIAGAGLTARLAPDRPMAHAMRLGYVGTILGLIGVAVTWTAGLGPKWYPISLAVLAIPQCWVGGKIYEWWLAVTAFLGRRNAGQASRERAAYSACERRGS